MATTTVYLFHQCLCIILTLTYGAKILVVPVQIQSHITEALHVVDELPSRGHEVYLVLSEATSVPKSLRESGIRLLTYKSRQAIHQFETDDFVRKQVGVALLHSPDEMIALFQNLSARIVDDCTEMMEDNDLLNAIKALQFDLAVVDAFTLCPCTSILPYNLSIPFITAGTDYNPTIHASPLLPSFVPIPAVPYTDRMTFTERIKNTVMTASFFYRLFTIGQKETTLLTKYGRSEEDVGRVIFTLPRECVLSIVNTDHVLAYPIPTMPRVILAGGPTTKPAKALTPDFNGIVERSTNDVIVVSFGSIAKFLPDHITEKLAEAFAHVKYTIIWRHDGHLPHKLSDNVHIRNWLPQNDLLGHPKTKLFVTHSGNNGQFEALYHGVPMVGFYLWGDQEYNALRMSVKGFGVKIDFKDFTAHELVTKMNDILTNPIYRRNIQRASRMYRDRPMTARETSAFWIEHVLKYGSDHLRSGATDLPWYAYFMLDILLLVLSGIMLALIAVFYCACFILKKCSQSSVNVEKKKQ